MRPIKALATAALLATVAFTNTVTASEVKIDSKAKYETIIANTTAKTPYCIRVHGNVIKFTDIEYMTAFKIVGHENDVIQAVYNKHIEVIKCPK